MGQSSSTLSPEMAANIKAQVDAIIGKWASADTLDLI